MWPDKLIHPSQRNDQACRAKQPTSPTSYTHQPGCSRLPSDHCLTARQASPLPPCGGKGPTPTPIPGHASPSRAPPPALPTARACDRRHRGRGRGCGCGCASCPVPSPDPDPDPLGRGRGRPCGPRGLARRRLGAPHRAAAAACAWPPPRPAAPGGQREDGDVMSHALHRLKQQHRLGCG